MAQKREGHGGDGIGTLQHTSVRVQPSLTNYKLCYTAVRGQVGQGMVCVVVAITIWAAECDEAIFRCELSLVS